MGHIAMMSMLGQLARSAHSVRGSLMHGALRLDFSMGPIKFTATSKQTTNYESRQECDTAAYANHLVYKDISMAAVQSLINVLSIRFHTYDRHPI
jgi:hypothetical protein